ncbi:MAG: helix-turn-helix transcriptional regulator, partial [Paludibacteraceae bacterium]|nr:helix-turn-helix transcriptional regulator [Paludibacteraceae bacterium]
AIIEVETARAMLMQYSERIHDLETFRIVQVNSDLQWKQMMATRRTMIVVIVIVVLLFLAALGGLVYFQLRIQREISKEILPQLEDVQEAIQLSKRDEAFAERLRQIVDEHLTDPNLSVEYLGSMLGLSRTQIFRRVKTVTGKGPLDYIRERRLERADHLLSTTDMTVQQVAIELCFSTPSYFTKCYKDYFKHLPSER